MITMEGKTTFILPNAWLVCLGNSKNNKVRLGDLRVYRILKLPLTI